MTNATDRNIINRDNYEFCFNELLASRGIRIQNDVLTKETVNAQWLKCVSTFFGIICSALTIYNPMSPNTTVRAAGRMAADASTVLNKTNTLYNYGYGEDFVNDDVEDKINVTVNDKVNVKFNRNPDYPRSGFTDQGTCYADVST